LASNNVFPQLGNREVELLKFISFETYEKVVGGDSIHKEPIPGDGEPGP